MTPVCVPLPEMHVPYPPSEHETRSSSSEADPLLAWQARYGHFVNVDAPNLGSAIVIAQAPSRRTA